ncbi:MAG: translocation/assembly module TamB domain-containing protein [Candidatus Firestonebacteria bacterium]
MKQIIYFYSGAESVAIAQAKGRLFSELSLSNLEIADIKKFPVVERISMQDLSINIAVLSFNRINLKVFNGRAEFAGKDALFFSGEYRGNNLNLNVYSDSLKIKNLADVLLREADKLDISGTLKALDVYIRGPLFKPFFSGKLLITTLSSNGIHLKDAPLFFNLELRDIGRQAGLFGILILEKGLLKVKKSTDINIKRSLIVFSGSVQEAALNLRAESVVEGVKIKISLKGTALTPQLLLVSEPALPQSRLLLMLATGRSWQSLEESLKKGEFSMDAAKEFLGYFFFPGAGSAAKKLLDFEISTTYKEQGKGLLIEKGVSEKTKVGYATESTSIEGERKQAITGKYDITDTLSLEAKRDIGKQQVPSVAEETPKQNSEISVKFKKEF